MKRILALVFIYELKKQYEGNKIFSSFSFDFDRFILEVLVALTNKEE